MEYQIFANGVENSRKQHVYRLTTADDVGVVVQINKHSSKRCYRINHQLHETIISTSWSN